jgi:hypothetical protein
VVELALVLEKQEAEATNQLEPLEQPRRARITKIITPIDVDQIDNRLDPAVVKRRGRREHEAEQLGLIL